MRTLDSFEIEGPVVLIKLDVQGNEVRVLEGVVRLLQRDRPVIVYERNDGCTKAGRRRAAALCFTTRW